MVVRGANAGFRAAFSVLPAGRVSLTVIPNGYGEVSVMPHVNTFLTGQIVTNTAIPDAGQEFLGWSGDASGTHNPLVLTIAESKVITANFTKRPRLEVEGSDLDGLLLTLTGEFTGNYHLLRSTQLTDWVEYLTLTNAYGEAQMIEPLSTERGVFCQAAATSQLQRRATAIPTLVNGFVIGITVIDGGEGYTTPPIVKITGGGGSGATAVATIVQGVVDKVIIKDAGSGYNDALMVLIDAPSP